ncbi:cyclin-K-like [Bufo bufo]|uniref:cyclin-K-like n=1 Tax=Bufo bufo TaxID=8384 RepID=UPI001ABE3B93|nr:cyclin-K-like [Bufo bufo]
MPRQVSKPMDVEKMIVEVQGRPCLWDSRSGDYQDRYKKDFDEVKNRWQSCRDQFRKEMVHHGHSGSGPLKKRPYIYKEHLMFLRDIMDVRPTEDNLEEETEQPAQQYSSAAEEENPPSLDTEEMSEAGPSTSSTPHIPPAESAPSLQLGARRKRPMPTAEVEVNTQVLDYLSRVRQEDHYELYGRSLGTLFKKIPEDLYLRTQGAIGIIIQAATPPKDLTELFIALENCRLYGNIYGPPPRPTSQFPNRAPHYPPPPPRQPFPPPPQQYGPLYSAEAAYPPPAPSAAQAAPPEHFAPSSQGSYQPSQSDVNPPPTPSRYYNL